MARQKTIIVVGYLRVSGKGQINGFGFDRQEETIKSWATHNGATISHLYREEASGTKDETHRPAFAEMVSDILSNGCRTIVVESLDRFARDLAVQMQLLAYLKAKGIRLFSVSTGDDVIASMEDDPMRKAMVQIQGVFSELDKNLTVRKLRKARIAKRAETGRCEGRKPFGFYPEEKRVLARAKELYRKPKGRSRKSLQKVADILNAEEMSTRTGVPWTKQVLHRIISR
jgi:site-specific DNA recombinase